MLSVLRKRSSWLCRRTVQAERALLSRQPRPQQQGIDELRTPCESLLLVAVNMSALGKATQAAVAAEVNPGTIRVEKRSKRRALEKTFYKSKASEVGYLQMRSRRECAEEP